MNLFNRSAGANASQMPLHRGSGDHAERKDLHRRLKRCQVALSTTPNDIDHLEDAAWLTFNLGQWRACAGHLAHRAHTLAGQGEFEAALADCRSALELVANYEPARAIVASIRSIRACYGPSQRSDFRADDARWDEKIRRRLGPALSAVYALDGVDLQRLEAGSALLPVGPRVMTRPAWPVNSPHLRVLPKDVQEDVLHASTQVRADAGETIVAPFTQCEAVFIVLFGRVALLRRSGRRTTHVTTLNPGDLLGDLEQVQGGPWRMEAVTTEATGLARIGGAAIATLRRRYPSFQKALCISAHRRHAAWLLSAASGFARVPPRQRERLLRHLGVCALAPMDAYRTHDRTEVILVGKGRLRVSVGRERHLTVGVGSLLNAGSPDTPAHPLAIAADRHGALLYLFPNSSRCGL